MSFEIFIDNYWPLLITVLPVLAKVINKLTPHWSAVSGKIHKILLLAVELFDLIRGPEIVQRDPTKEAIKKKVKEIRSGDL